MTSQQQGGQLLVGPQLPFPHPPQQELRAPVRTTAIAKVVMFIFLFPFHLIMDGPESPSNGHPSSSMGLLEEDSMAVEDSMALVGILALDSILALGSIQAVGMDRSSRYDRSSSL